MDIFEKQQTIEAIKTIVKARWFYASVVLLQGIILKLLFPSTPLPNDFLIPLIFVSVLVLNFGYWAYLRIKPENINSLTLKFIKFFQVSLDQLAIAAIIYFSGTANKQIIMMYIVTIMIASVLYKAKGVILWTFFAMLLYTGLVFLEYFGLLPELAPEAASQTAFKFLKGETNFTKMLLIGFNTYMIAVALYAVYLVNIFRNREKKLRGKTDEAIKKSELLTLQTQELSKTKDYLHEALTKSDAARVEIEKTKAELEKANLELQAKVRELEKYGQVTTGRELKMIELKEEIKNLRETVENLKDQLALNK
ncbi:MAG: hypothetical protein COV84_01355 [Candidatus Portnoybacteria bacterium CG11_big_fil_rev_8_21_14_0_20_40_15]|uniref:Uncharacterized protein n=5 Tax=Candidatus Portnoyibacteriota TaxID=1817913 RepID=A0A2H0KTI0_9BACT|nr:MAG: hypothetical protein COV84_01355 [Candidatus Portnoybacteria bacterium CG11_big_fil_rev_8_21_14_0_20_40_15]PJA64549.1 MAG: hypothetical protein CO159_02560 [Candidatus Portnoybacteria bacterium CG_4_9_14_3_um_filter_40_10]